MAQNSVKLLVIKSNEGVESTMQPLFGEIWAVDDFRPYNPDELLPVLEVGDEVWLKLDSQGYSHVLLYIGNGEVVHVSNVDKPGLAIGKTLIRRDYLNEVAEGHLVGYRKTADLTDEMRKQIRKRGLSDVGKYFSYILTTENCEHQVKYWISGVKDYRWIVSTQIRDHIVIALGCGIVGAAIGACLVLTFWSTEMFPIAMGALGGGIGTAIIGTGLKYGISAIENRSWFCC